MQRRFSSHHEGAGGLPSGGLRLPAECREAAKTKAIGGVPPESSAVFPIIFLSKERDHPTYKSLALGRTHGVFGIGSAINFNGPSSATAGELSESGRYVSIDPKLIVAYEFFSIDSDKLLSFMKHEAG
nr:protein PHYLLO, chloroplastic isoform X2 [Ipomoea batatas]